MVSWTNNALLILLSCLVASTEAGGGGFTIPQVCFGAKFTIPDVGTLCPNIPTISSIKLSDWGAQPVPQEYRSIPISIKRTDGSGCFSGSTTDGNVITITPAFTTSTCAEWAGKEAEVCVGACGARRLQAVRNAISLDAQDSQFQTVAKQCGDFDYEGSLVVDSHMHVVGTPKEEAMAAGCPAVVMHAVYDMPSDKSYRKEILIITDKEDVEAMLVDSYPLGTFKAAEVVRAHEGIDPTKGGTATAYDVVKNNCGHFLLSLASALDVKVDAKMASYVSRRLIQESGKTLANKIRDNLGYFSLFENRNLRSTVTDEQVIELLVKKSIPTL